MSFGFWTFRMPSPDPFEDDFFWETLSSAKELQDLKDFAFDLVLDYNFFYYGSQTIDY